MNANTLFNTEHTMQTAGTGGRSVISDATQLSAVTVTISSGPGSLALIIDSSGDRSALWHDQATRGRGTLSVRVTPRSLSVCPHCIIID